MNIKINKTDSYNPPTEYDTSKVFITRLEFDKEPDRQGILYKIVFRGSLKDLANTQMLMEQSQLHLKHENLTGFKPVFPWPPAEDHGDLSERTCTFKQITL